PDGSKLWGQQQTTWRRIGERSLTSGDIRGFGDSPGTLHDISPDGKDALFWGDGRILSTHLEGTAQERAPRTIVQNSYSPRFSPDGHWIVYAIRQQGIFVQPFPGPGLRRQVTSDGTYPVWRRDGKEIVYGGAAGSVWSVNVESAGNELRFAAPRKLFSGLRSPAGATTASHPLEVSRDGSHIYFPQAVEQPNSDVINVRMG